MSKYGIPYKGSKGNIVEKFIHLFPKADNFYDIFGGGFSVTHCMLLKRCEDYNTFHFNEINNQLLLLIKNAINGEYDYINLPKWVSREEFFDKKDSDPYIKYIWSFGNTGNSYLFGKNIEKYKESIHNAVVFGEFDALSTEVLDRDSWDTDNFKERRLFVRHKIEEYRVTKIPLILHQFLHTEQLQQLERLEQLEQLQQLQQLERLEQLQQLQQLLQLERLQQLQQLERLDKLKGTALDYRKVCILPNSVVYCDPPYKNTSSYGSIFNTKEFLDWAAGQENPVYISEYEIQDSRFEAVFEIKKRALMDNSKKSCKNKIEKIYWNKKSLK